MHPTSLLTGLFAEMTVNQLFRKLDAFEFHESSRLFNPPISGMLIFHGRVKTFGSSMVAS